MNLARIEDPALLCGQGRFLDDLDPLPGTLTAAIVRSPFPHARITGFDARQALALARRGRGHRPGPDRGRTAPVPAVGAHPDALPRRGHRPGPVRGRAGRRGRRRRPLPGRGRRRTRRRGLRRASRGHRYQGRAGRGRPAAAPGGGVQRGDRPHVQLRPGRGGLRRRRPRGQRRLLLPPLLLDADGVLRRGGELDRDGRRARGRGLGQLPRPVQHDPGAGRLARRPGRPAPAARARGHRRQLRHQGGHLPLRHADGAGQQARRAPGPVDRGPAGAPGRVLGRSGPADAVRGRGHRGRDRHRAAGRPGRQRGRLPAPARAVHAVPVLRQHHRRLPHPGGAHPGPRRGHQQDPDRAEPRVRRPAAVLRPGAADGQGRRGRRPGPGRRRGGGTSSARGSSRTGRRPAGSTTRGTTGRRSTSR